ncbi:MAG: OmpA family protein [Polyangiales bacterium]
MNTSNISVLAILLVAGAGCGADPPPKPASSAHDKSDRPLVAAATPTRHHADSLTPKEPSDTVSSVVIDQAITQACNISAADAHFAFDSARVEEMDNGPLDRLATCFSVGALQGRKLVLVGRADPRGETEYNIALGQSRADAIQEYLRERGLMDRQMSSSSRGALDATGTDEQTWASDRRVDIVLVR